MQLVVDSQEENTRMRSKDSLLTISIFLMSVISEAQQLRNSTGRVMSLFSVIQFPNIDCVDKDGINGEDILIIMPIYAVGEKN